VRNIVRWISSKIRNGHFVAKVSVAKFIKVAELWFLKAASTTNLIFSFHFYYIFHCFPSRAINSPHLHGVVLLGSDYTVSCTRLLLFSFSILLVRYQPELQPYFVRVSVWHKERTNQFQNQFAIKSWNMLVIPSSFITFNFYSSLKLFLLKFKAIIIR